MITPSFSCTQNDTSVVVSIYAPAVRAADVEIHIEETLFVLHINPYFLRLGFSGRLIEDDSSSAQYDPSRGYLTVTLTKETPGEVFSDLDILSKLLAPKKEDPPRPIEVISSTNHPIENAGYQQELVDATAELQIHDKEILDAADNDWLIPQQVEDDLPRLRTTTERRYGFANLHTGYFRHVTNTENEINELADEVETMDEIERRKRRIRHEEQKWDEEHYMADFADDEYIQELIAFDFPEDAPALSKTAESFSFSDEEKQIMLQLPQREYFSTPQQEHNVYLTLLTILFSYAYDSRTNMYDPTPESAWTICVMTPAFSALDPAPYSDDPQSPLPLYDASHLHDNLLPSIRRSLAFPLYRSCVLTEKCISDVGVILQGGKRTVLRALLQTKKILEGHEVYYVYSKIWVVDYCAWISRCSSDEVLGEIGRMLRQLRIDKKAVGWDLVELEATVLSKMNRDTDSDDNDSDSD